MIIATIIGAIAFLPSIALNIALALGAPLGAYAMNARYKVIPPEVRKAFRRGRRRRRSNYLRLRFRYRRAQEELVYRQIKFRLGSHQHRSERLLRGQDDRRPDSADMALGTFL